MCACVCVCIPESRSSPLPADASQQHPYSGGSHSSSWCVSTSLFSIQHSAFSIQHHKIKENLCMNAILVSGHVTDEQEHSNNPNMYIGAVYAMPCVERKGIHFTYCHFHLLSLSLTSIYTGDIVRQLFLPPSHLSSWESRTHKSIETLGICWVQKDLKL